jgi:hypothetical protein
MVLRVENNFRSKTGSRSFDMNLDNFELMFDFQGYKRKSEDVVIDESKMIPHT